MPGNEATELLRERPLDFIRRYAISPPNQAKQQVGLDALGQPRIDVSQTLTNRRTLWTDPGGVIGTGTGTVTHQRVSAGRVQHASVIDITTGEKSGAKTLEMSPNESDSRVPVHFLPWGSEQLIDMKIPEAGPDTDDPSNPRIFFTAALSGCSIFVDGDPKRPRVVHAGIDGALNTGARGFWEERLVDLARQSGQPIDDHMRSIDKSRYMNTDMAIHYRNWLRHEYSDTLTIKGVTEWGAVFGIRFGSLWSFYLQRNATVTTTRLLKKRMVEKYQPNSTTTRYRTRDGGAPVEMQTVRKGKGILAHDKKIYVLQEIANRPMGVEEFYPGKGGTGGVRMGIESRYQALF